MILRVCRIISVASSSSPALLDHRCSGMWALARVRDLLTGRADQVPHGHPDMADVVAPIHKQARLQLSPP